MNKKHTRINKSEVSKRFTKDSQIFDFLQQLSKKSQDMYITFSMSPAGHLDIYEQAKKPSKLDVDTETSYEYLGGFLKNGVVSIPSNSFIQKYNKMPTIR